MGRKHKGHSKTASIRFQFIVLWGTGREEDRVKIVVDLDICESNGQCEISAPDVFRLDEDGTLHYEAEPPEALADDVRVAIGSCPTQAIRLIAD